MGFEHKVDPGGQSAVIAQLGERTTEDRKVPGSIPGDGIFFIADSA